MQRRTSNGSSTADRLARGLGWLSVGLGLAGLMAPRRVARLVGTAGDERSRDAVVAVGLRELASGVGLLARPRPGWAYARVGGDIMDLALLGLAMRSDRTDTRRVAGAMAAVLGVTAIDVLATRRLQHAGDGASAGLGAGRPIEVVEAITIRGAPEELYGFWRSLANLPRFMTHLEEIRVLDERRSHWVARGPVGAKVEWDAEIVEDVPGRRIAWRSLPGADVPNSGAVSFLPAPGGRGTEVRVELRYDPPGGRLGMVVAQLTGVEPGQAARSDLRRLKQVIEVGEVVESDSSIHRGMHPARPAGDRPAREPRKTLPRPSGRRPGARLAQKEEIR